MPVYAWLLSLDSSMLVLLTVKVCLDSISAHSIWSLPYLLILKVTLTEYLYQHTVCAYVVGVVYSETSE